MAFFSLKKRLKKRKKRRLAGVLLLLCITFTAWHNVPKRIAAKDREAIKNAMEKWRLSPFERHGNPAAERAFIEKVQGFVLEHIAHDTGIAYGQNRNAFKVLQRKK